MKLVEVKKSGVCVLEGTPVNGQTYLKAIRGAANKYWTSYHWLKAAHEIEPIDFGGWKEELRKFYKHDADIRAIFSAPKGLFSVCQKYFKISLWDTQMLGGYIMAHAKRFLLSDDVGMGKTLTTIAGIFNVSDLLDRPVRAVIICPSSVLYQWEDEMREAVKLEHHDRIDSIVIRGLPRERVKQYQQDKRIYLVNYETFLSDYKKGVSFKYPIDILVLDEAWKVKNRSTQVHKAVADFARGVQCRFGLNGTPIANRYEDLYGAYEILDPLIFISHANFDYRYIRTSTIRLRDGRIFPKVVGYKRVDELVSRLSARFIRRTIADTGWDQPTVTVVPYWVELDDYQRKEYQKLAANREMNPLEKITKARLICLRSASAESSPKFQAVVDLLEHVFPEQKVLLFSDSLTTLKEYKVELEKRKILPLLICGENTSEERNLICDYFKRGKSRLLMLTSAGEAGLNLQASDVVINLDIPWSPKSLQQRVGRVRPHLGGNSRTIRVVNILARNTIEERVIVVLKEKLGHVSRFFQAPVEDFVGVFDHVTLAQNV